MVLSMLNQQLFNFTLFYSCQRIEMLNELFIFLAAEQR